MKYPPLRVIMKEKQNIDDLFKERFKNFETTPSPQVWKNIQAKLSAKSKEKKVIPIWIKWGGVAALIALLLTVGNTVFNTSVIKTMPIVTEEKTNAPETLIKENKGEAIEIVSEEKSTPMEPIDNASKEKEIIKKSAAKTSVINEAVAKNDAVVKDKTNIEKNNDIPVISDKNAIVEENKSNKEISPKDNLPETNKAETEVVITEESKKRSIFDAIDEKEEETVIVSNNKPDNRWDISPNIAPVYYSSLGEGSSIDPTFSDNQKSGDLNLSYGVLVSYNLNNRLSVRSGISNVNLSYSTTGIELGIGPLSAATQSIDYNKATNVLIVVDQGTLSAANNDSNNDSFGSVTPKSTSGEASLNQKLSYLEMPLELKYSLLNNKIGLNLIGGFSTLLLNNNEVFVEAGDFNETLGKANNLSSLSFTTNIGLGLNYSFSKKLMINIEPMFKYQLNPYSDSSVEYKPYYIGVYSGLSFKF